MIWWLLENALQFQGASLFLVDICEYTQGISE